MELGTSTGGGGSSSDLGDLLECSVCLESLGSNHKVLPCQHTFCTSCLMGVRNRRLQMREKQKQRFGAHRQRYGEVYDKELDEFELVCPECRSPCPVQLEKLPSNVILNRILEFSKTKMSSSSSTSAMEEQNKANRNQSESAKNVTNSGIPGNPSTNPFVDVIQEFGNASLNDSVVILDSIQPPSLPPKNSTRTLSNVQQPPPVPSTSSKPLQQFPKQQTSQPSQISSSSTAAAAVAVKNPHEMYRALFDYVPRKPDELPLIKGELYVVTEKCGDGWYKGSSISSLKIGCFPGNFVQHVSSSQNRKNSMPNTNSSGILVPQKAPAVIQAVPTSSRHSEEIHLESLEHQPTTLVDLEQESSRNNESVEVIDLTSTLVADPNVNNPSFVADWSKLSSSSSVPNFSGAISSNTSTPSSNSANTTPKHRPAPPPPSQSQSAVARPRPSVTSRSGVPIVPPPRTSKPTTPGASTLAASSSTKETQKHRFKCIMDYPACSEYELNLKKGDTVTLLKKRDDGWCKGILERTNKAGLFPITFVEKL